MTVVGTYDPLLVGVSLFVAVFASFTGLSLARWMTTSTGRARTAWLIAAAFALGGGIWSMHFIGMLAFSIPGMRMIYDPWLTVVSFVIPICLTGLALAIAARDAASRARLAVGGLLMATGVLAMHYLGMAAMQMRASIEYDALWVSWSAIIAIVASVVAVWLAFARHEFGHRIAASIAMGVAIAGMHYTAMAAATFISPCPSDAPVIKAGIDPTSLAAIVAVFAIFLFLLALGAARLDHVFKTYERREARIALRLKIADILREQGSGEALREIAAIMGGHFGVTRTGYGQLDPVEDYFDYDICWTDGTVPALLGRYPAAAFGEKIVAALAAGSTIVVEDILSEPISDEDRTRDTAREVDTRAILVVPFVRDGRLRTIVYLNDREPRRWDPEDIAFMEELAERTRLVIERDAVEQQLRELNASLESRVEERTRDLEQAQQALLQSQKMEAVGQLVAGMAHDFNNVLASVIGAFNLILRNPDDTSRVRKFAGAGAQAAERGAKLTGQLLAFSRAQRIQLRPLFICDVIADMEDLLARTLGPLITLERDLNPTPAPVLADATQVEMMILNLAINARDAMPEGGTLTLSTSKHTFTGDSELADGDYIQLAVCDTGTGMDEDTLRRAMEPFFTTKPVGQGTGLGLAQIYGSARQAGGTARIESEVGVGTAVRVYLPCTEGSRNSQTDSAQTAQDASDLPPLQILLVDDDDNLRAVLCQALSDDGHQVTTAPGGNEALSLIESETPQVAILDYAMPGMNGAILAEQIAARLPDLPIIFVSGYADTVSIKKAAGENVTILHKPFEMDQLNAALHRAWSLAQSSPSAAC
jgi:NO-binding membrane sensor protein with MHYT domain/signal transduction histidine kinase/ActR/RegA family two-component response regulator